MSADPPATAAAIAEAAALVERWTAGLVAAGVAAHVEPVPAERRWLVRLRGEEKSIITVWLTLGERTLRYETYFMPAPEENVTATYEYLLRVNSRLYGMRFAIGDEDAIYLTGQIPVGEIAEISLDRIIGTSYAYSEQYFRTALSIGFESRVRPLVRDEGQQ